MFLTVEFLVLVFALFTGGVDHTVSPVNRKDENCPHGIYYRQGCEICYCIATTTSDVPKRFCASRYTDEDCDYWAQKIHCEERRLEYNYNKKCEGSCECKRDMNEFNTITTCTYLPCHEKILEDHGVLHTHDFKVKWETMENWKREAVIERHQGQGRARIGTQDDTYQDDLPRLVDAPPKIAFMDYDDDDKNSKLLRAMQKTNTPLTKRATEIQTTATATGEKTTQRLIKTKTKPTRKTTPTRKTKPTEKTVKSTSKTTSMKITTMKTMMTTMKPTTTMSTTLTKEAQMTQTSLETPTINTIKKVTDPELSSADDCKESTTADDCEDDFETKADRTRNIIADHTVSPANRKDEDCPHGIYYRQGCEICYCIAMPTSDVPKRFCASRYTDEDCGYWAQKIHCKERRLEYNYNKNCEGPCECKREKDEFNTITTCAYLPCHERILEENGILKTTDFKYWWKIPARQKWLD